MRIGFVKDDVPPAPPRAAFWRRGGVSLIELIAAVGILAIMLGIVAVKLAG